MLIRKDISVTREMAEAGARVLLDECGYSGTLRTVGFDELAREVFTEMARVAPASPSASLAPSPVALPHAPSSPEGV